MVGAALACCIKKRAAEVLSLVSIEKDGLLLLSESIFVEIFVTVVIFLVLHQNHLRRCQLLYRVFFGIVRIF